MSATARLAQLGISLPSVAAPVGSYLPAVWEGDLVFTSGQLPFEHGALPSTGVVGADVDLATAQALTRTAALNALAAAAAAVGGVAHIARIVKLVVFVASAPSFTGQPQVANGASDLLVEIFGDAGRHARSAVGVTSLPMGSPVEVELICQVH